MVLDTHCLELIRANLHLLICYPLACWQHSVTRLKLILYVEQQLLVGADAIHRISQINRRTLLWRNIEIHHHATLHGATISHQAPLHLILREIGEEVLVIDLNDTLLSILQLAPDRLIEVVDLIGMRVEVAIGIDDTIRLEVVVRSVVGVEVTTIGVDLDTRLACPVNSLIDEVPDKSTLEVRVLAD